MKDPRKKRRMGGGVIMVIAAAIAVGYFFRGCGGEIEGVGKQGAKVENKVESSAGKTVAIKVIRVVLKDDKLYHGTRLMTWVQFDALTQEAEDRQLPMELVVYESTMTTGVMRRVERQMAQTGAGYSYTRK